MIDRVTKPRTTIAAKVPNLPAPPAKLDPPLRKYLETLAEAIEIRLGRRGDARDRAITLRELIDSGMAEDLILRPFVSGATQDFAAPSPWTGNEIPFYNTPPAPTSFSASGGYEIVILSWDFPYYRNHAHTEIWRHDSDSIGDATLIGVHSGRVYIDYVGNGVTRYYWARHVNTAGTPGPFHSASGETGTTSPNVTLILNELSTAIRSTHLHSTLSSPIGNLPANTNDAIALAQSKIDVWSSTDDYAVDKIVRAGASDTKLYICIQAVGENSGIALSNDSYWKLYGDYDVLKSTTDTSTAAITAINTIATNSGSVSAQKIAALNLDVGRSADGSGSPHLSATNLSTMSSHIFTDAANNTLRVTNTQLDYLKSSYTSPTTGTANAVTLAVATETSADNVNGLRGQYSVKIDTNGHVAGFGLSSTATTGTPTSAFIVRADKFAVINPSDTGSGLGTNSPSSSIVPFIIDNGNTYIASAMIKDASIVNAKIGSLSATKLTADTIHADRFDVNSIAASKVKLDNATIEGNASGQIIIKNLGVGTAKIADLAVTDAKISNLSATKIDAGTLTVYNAAASNTVGKLFTVTTGYVATTSYDTNSTTNMSYASVSSDWTGGNYNNPWHYNNTAGTTMPGLLIDGTATGNNFTIPDVDGSGTHVLVSVHFGTNPVGHFNGDETSFCVCHLQRQDSGTPTINNTGVFNENLQVWGGSVTSVGSMAAVPRYGVFTVSLNPGKWHVWLYGWSRKADLSSSSHGFSDNFVHVNSFYK